MLYSLTEYGRYGRNPKYISGVCVLDTRDLHVVQVGKDSTWSKNILLIALTMKCKFSKSCVFFSFKAFFWRLMIAWFFFIQKMTVFLGGYLSLYCYFSIVDLCFVRFFWWFFRLNLKKCQSGTMIAEFSGQRWSLTMIKIIERTNGKFVFADVTWICNSFLFTLKICKACKIISDFFNLINFWLF